MITAGQARRLIAYNEWANTKILAAIDGMTSDEIERPVDAYIGSIGKNLAHILGGQRIWLARWKGVQPPRLDESIAGSANDAFGASHAELRAFVEAMTDTDCLRVIAFRDTAGNARELRLGHLVTHLVNHGTHHRGETGMLLERIGRSPGDMDYHYFLYEIGDV